MARKGPQWPESPGQSSCVVLACFDEHHRIPHPRSADFTDLDSWHPSGWSPVHDRVTSLCHLVGFTTQQCAFDRLMIGQETGDDNGAFQIVAEARVALAGAFDSWVVESGDYRAFPSLWTL